MTVYVDPAQHKFGRMVMCHCWSDSLDELFAMMDRIGVPRKWLQRPHQAAQGQHRLYPADPRMTVGMDATWVHFDIAKSKRALAVVYGAVETDMFGPLEFEGRLFIASGDPDLIILGERKLARVEHSRALRKGGK